MMAEQPTSEQYVLLPGGQLRAAQSTPEVRQFFAGLAAPGQMHDLDGAIRGAQLRVIDSLGPDGATLIDASPEALLALRRLHPGVSVVPLRHYTPAIARRHVERHPAGATVAPGPQ